MESSELSNEYRSLIDAAKQLIPEAVTPDKVRAIAVIFGKASFIYDFAIANNISVEWAYSLGVTFHEQGIYKLWLAYSIGVGYEAEKKKETQFRNWLETGYHERFCYYKGKYSESKFPEPKMACSQVEKNMGKWGLKAGK